MDVAAQEALHPGRIGQGLTITIAGAVMMEAEATIVAVADVVAVLTMAGAVSKKDLLLVQEVLAEWVCESPKKGLVPFHTLHKHMACGG